MKKITGLLWIAALLCGAACRTNESAPVAPAPFTTPAPADALQITAEPGRYGGTLALALPQNPSSFNPILANDNAAQLALNHTVYKGLVEYDNAAQQDAPALAKSWEAAPDGLTWTFKLRQDVLWSDGQPFSADDVLFTFGVTFDEKIAAAGRDLFIQSDDSLPVIEKLDAHTVRFKLKEPNALFLSSVGSTPLIPKHKLDAAYQAGKFAETLGLNATPANIVGLGPYRVASFTADQRLVLERNTNYWKVDRTQQRLPYLDRVVFMIVPDANAATLKLQSGELDMLAEINPETVDLLKRDETRGGYQVYDLGASFNTTFLVFNQDTAKYKNATKLRWFRDVKFRQAISYAINREALVRTVFLGYGVALHGFVSPANKTWFTSDIAQYPHNPDRAKALLNDIGIRDRNGDGTLEDASNQPIKFTINTNTNNATRVKIGTLLKEQLAALGIEVNFQPLEFNTLIGKLAQSRDFDAIIMGWQSAVPPDPVVNQSALLPTGAMYGAFPNQKTPGSAWEKQLQSLLLENARETDMTKRRASFAAAMKIWSEQLPEIDLVAPRSFAAAKKRFGNFKPSPLANYTYWNVDELYVTN
jgi:peptide/nickel transport system substrate-binding protein